MSLKLNSSGGGSITLQEPTTASNRTLNLPDADGTVVYADGSGNVGIGTSSTTSVFSNYKSLYLNGSSGSAIQMQYNGNLASNIVADNNALYIQNITALAFATGGTGTGTERARIDSSGNLLVGRTGLSATERLGVTFGAGNEGIRTVVASTALQYHAVFNNGSSVGAISTNGSATTYSTSSDYRLKENVQPMTGALAKVAALKPCTYTWKSDGSAGEGFIAHELQAVVPDAVTGEKDAVNEDGSIKPQGIDTSFLVATIVAAMKEQQQMIETLQAKVAALEAK